MKKISQRWPFNFLRRISLNSWKWTFVLREAKREARAIGGDVIVVARGWFPGGPARGMIAFSRVEENVEDYTPLDNKFVLSPALLPPGKRGTAREQLWRKRERERERETASFWFTPSFFALVYNYAIFSPTSPYFFVPGDAPRSKSARHEGVVKSTRLAELEKGGGGQNRKRRARGDDPLGVPWDLALLVSPRISFFVHPLPPSSSVCFSLLFLSFPAHSLSRVLFIRFSG